MKHLLIAAALYCAWYQSGWMWIWIALLLPIEEEKIEEE